jgi:hypothetical protein
MRTVILVCKRQLLYVFFLLLPFCLFAQTGNREVVALIPFWGVDETAQIEFAEEVLDGINRLAGYRSSLIDMTNIPEDVPEGGYEPNVCPSPSLTRGLPYAMTGEITEDYDSGGFAMRLYLWRMEGTRLVYSDRMVAFDREVCRLVLPGLLDWMFSFLKDIENPFQLVGAGGAGGGGDSSLEDRVRIFAPEEPDHWLYVGARAGISMKMLANPDQKTPINPYRYNNEDLPGLTTMNVINAAATVSWMFPDNALFASPFGLQAEFLFNIDTEPEFNYSTLAIAAILRTHLYRGGKASIVLLTGGYFALKPIENENGFNNNMVMVGDTKYENGFGLTAGVTAGQKFGPGYLYLEVRWMGDLFATTYKDGNYEGFNRHLFGLCIGYEFGIIEKKKSR